MRLNDSKVRNAKLQSRSYKLSDAHGLYLLVAANGSKYWRMKYRLAGREKLLALGVYPETSLKEAREKTLQARKLLAEGGDPSLIKQQQKLQAALKAEHCFEAIAKEWWQHHQHKWSDAHAQAIWRRLENNLLPKLGRLPVADISPLQLLAVIKEAEKRGATELAHKLLQHCSAIYRYAVLYGKATHDIAADLRGALKAHKGGNYPTINAAELPEFLQKLAAHPTSLQNKLAIKLLLLTFVRQGELRKAHWHEFDMERAQWRIPAERMKMRDEHIVPLSQQALDILRQLQTIAGWSDYLLPSQNRQKNPYMSENTINKIIKDMGYEGRMVGHGVRALASTVLNEHGFKPDVIERQLAHAERNKVRAAYNRAEYLAERKTMMQWWGDYLEEAKK